MFRCAHFADIHFRGLTRHEEYREVFSESFVKLKQLSPDLIFIGGDIVHSKTQGISPELIHILTWWFNSLAEIAPVHVILGNHDGLMLNEDRLDAITPILEAINNPDIKLFKDSGTYDTGIPGFKWNVFSCFDIKGWENVLPDPDAINIATFHGPVNGSLTDQDWEINGESVKVDFFNKFDFGFLGDIHKKQYLTPKIAYPGSTIQQNYGESIEKGFLFWEIEDKDTFNVEFIPLSNKRAFRTYRWKGSVIDTLEQIPDYASGSRFRIAHEGIDQVSFKQLQRELKERFSAEEVVSKNETKAMSDSDVVITTSVGEISRADLRSFKYQDRLMSDFITRNEIPEEAREELRTLHKNIFHKCVQQVSQNAHQWRLRRLAFDNTFGYGEDNVIDFDVLNGITGIFGKNRCGKSSIPGTLVYGLFNATDRGALKNLHVINSRKNFCKSTVDISVGSKLYRAERQTIKRVSRKGVVSAPTHLNLYALDQNRNIETDSTEEQRRETEKVLKNLVGSVDDFLMTSFASQGDMNAFIREGATQRKAILTRFLDLQIFDEMLKMAKSEMTELRGEMKSAPDRDWDTLISEQTVLLDSHMIERKEIEQELIELKENRDQLKLQLASSPADAIYTRQDIEKQSLHLKHLEERNVSISQKILDICSEMDATRGKIQKIDNICEQFPVDELREEAILQTDLTSQVRLAQSRLDLENQRLKSQQRSAKKLDSVPCGDQFPKCPYIRDAHKSSKELEGQKEIISSVKKELSAIKRNLDKLIGKGLSDKISKYESMLASAQSLRLKNSDMKLELRESESNQQSLTSELRQGKEHLREMRLRAADEEKDAEVIKMRLDLSQLEKRISEIDAERLYLAEQISLGGVKKKELLEEKERFGSLRTRWQTYTLLTQAVDKRGIPLTILSLQLPKINAELTKILLGVVNFDISIESKMDSNNLDIFIDYGDSKRIIECGSGMEKMISSLALRVALINICNAPRSDVLIIDEGFGALDDKNIEACSRLLISLKKYFSNILIISHVDAVKDIVDNVLDIQKVGRDAKVRYCE